MTPASGFVVRREPPVERGTTFLRQGEPFDSIYLLVSGCLCLRETTMDGAEHIVGFRTPGELVGLEGWARGQHPYSADAVELTAVCRLSWPRCVRRPGSALLERLLIKAVTQLDRSAQPWVGLPAVERVAVFVEDFARRTRTQGSPGERLRLPMTRAQIGSYLGLAEETVVRALAQLRLEERLDIHGKMVALRARA